ncbi:hypothetical protein [Legionella tucsonensis]|uniref:Transmembrane protein n=1 Tax=Legionella tucsonensis TaxID=40335 RepID=A0A0W0ZVN5_9GAMM|nr:hypothetical protein [Legionella tucsonensis]KTD73170.1 hypothetical protein Ltuc_1017 [Legionella tucsonensis]
MTIAKKLDKASGIFFFTGFLLSKLQYIPFPLASAIFRFVSLGIYSLAYLSWLTASLLHRDHPVNYRKWYGFAQVKEQFLLSSFVGFTATVLSVAAVFIPVLFPPAAWLFLIGNAIWAIGEYHKFKNPPTDDANYSSTRQKNYVSYAVTSTSISLVAAIAATLIFVFPPMAIPITIFSLIICAGLGALAFEFWLNCTFGNHKPDQIPESYTEIGDSLGLSVTQEPSNSPEPGCFNCLFPKPIKKSSNLIKLSSNTIELLDIEENQIEHSLQGKTLL